MLALASSSSGRTSPSHGGNGGSIPPGATNMIVEQQEKIIGLAVGLLGVPYKYGARLEEAPNFFDCASFVRYLFSQIKIDLGHTSLLQAASSNGSEVIPNLDFSNLEPGDLIFTRGKKGRYDDELFDGRKICIGHVAMFIGGGQIIHSRRRLGGVVKQNLRELISDPAFAVVLVKRF